MNACLTSRNTHTTAMQHRCDTILHRWHAYCCIAHHAQLLRKFLVLSKFLVCYAEL